MPDEPDSRWFLAVALFGSVGVMLLGLLAVAAVGIAWVVVEGPERVQITLEE